MIDDELALGSEEFADGMIWDGAIGEVRSGMGSDGEILKSDISGNLRTGGESPGSGKTGGGDGMSGCRMTGGGIIGDGIL